MDNIDLVSDSESSSSDLRIVTDSSDDDSDVQYVGVFPRGQFNDVAGNLHANNVPGQQASDDDSIYGDNPNGPQDNYFYDEDSPQYDSSRHATFHLWCGHLVIPRNCVGAEGDELSQLFSELRDRVYSMRDPQDGRMLDYAEFSPVQPLRDPDNWDLPCENYTALLRRVVADIDAERNAASLGQL